MCCSYEIISPRDTSLEEEGGANVDGAEWDGAKREERVAESDYCDRSWALLRLTLA